ncbi:MAG: pilus assembly protein [Propionibacteriaceae bacterium]|jgi:hypothetical protein|nr:pilus assembly protein [Propionibacteriaceae bacterium]
MISQRKTGRPQVWSRGSVSLEAIIIIPAFLLFLTLIIGIARVAIAQADLHAAAVQATRTAATAPDPATGDTAARQAISTFLTSESSPCVAPVIETDTAALALPPGQPGQVRVTVTCPVPLSDLMLPGLPGQVTLSGAFSTPIDAYSS